MSTKIDEKLKKFAELISKTVDQKLEKFKEEIKNIPTKVDLPAQQMTPIELVNAQLDMIAKGGSELNRQAFTKELGQLMLKFGIEEVIGKIRKNL